MNSFKVKPMQDAMETLQEEIRQFNPLKIVDACINQLRIYEETTDTSHSLRLLQQYPPWFLLLLIKWTFLHGGWSNLMLHKRFDSTTLGRLMNSMHGLNEFARLPRQYDHLLLFFRNLAFQQLWLQETGEKAGYFRQKFFFSDLPDNHQFKREFKQRSGIEIDHFIQLSFSLIGKFIEGDREVTESWFDSLQASYPPGTVKKFLSHISGDINEVQTHLKQDAEAKRDISCEIYEQSPLIRYPLLKINDKYYAYSFKLLIYSLKSFIYNILKTKNPGVFMDKFGKIFEEYIARGVDYMGLPHIREHALQKTLGEGKVVDFLIVDDNCNILIDAKGVEMNQRGMMGHRPELILDKTETSVVKGIQQGTVVADKLKSIPQIDGLQTGRENFLLVVTYKDFYIGNGETFYETIGKKKVDEVRSGYDASQLPNKNMYFISVDDFDYLVRLVRDGQCGLAKAIKAIRNADQDPNLDKRTFLFRYSLNTHCGNGYMQMPEYLENELENVTSTLHEMLDM